MSDTAFNTALDIAHEIAKGLYIVATPIGNAQDISLRALARLRGVDMIFCEDKRVTQKLCVMHNIKTPLATYHEHNAPRIRPHILDRLTQGARLALVSDAGTPLISDPGLKLVRHAQEAGLNVFTIPGASSPIAALSIAGLPTDRFFMHGFLPRGQKARQNILNELKNIRATLVFFETAPRLNASLADMVALYGDRQAALCRELTKKFEEVRRGTLQDLYDEYKISPPKGEMVLVVEGAQDVLRWREDEVRQALMEQLASCGTKEAAQQLATPSGWSQRALYQLALEIKKQEQD